MMTFWRRMGVGETGATASVEQLPFTGGFWGTPAAKGDEIRARWAIRNRSPGRGRGAANGAFSKGYGEKDVT
jgi:hypothetical protein